MLAGETRRRRSTGDDASRLGGGRALEADGVVAGLGIEPAVELAAATGLRGATTGSSSTSTAASAGATTCSPPATSRASRSRRSAATRASSTRTTRTRHGRAVGANMAGADEPYDHLPFFYSDLFELGYEAVGEVDSRHETVAEWAEPNRKGASPTWTTRATAARLPALGRLGKVDAARELIRAGEPVDPGALRALLG